ncbi:MAG TPA: hypothetical protein VGC30_14640 [Dokdonella sp.]
MSDLQVNSAGTAGTSVASADAGGYHSPSKAELEDMANDLHAVGDIKHKKDDYDKRLAALANDYLPKLNTEDKARFLNTILEKDKGALDSWLQGDRLDRLIQTGRIDRDAGQDMLEGFAKAYNSGQQHVDMDAAWKFFGMDGATKGYVYSNSSPNPGQGPSKTDEANANTSSTIYRTLVDGVENGNGRTSAEFSTFLKNFTTDEITKDGGKIRGDTYSADHGKELGVLFNAANRADGDQKLIADIYDGLTLDQRAAVTEALSKTYSDPVYVKDALTDQHKVDSNYADPMALLIKAVAHDGSDAAKESDGHLGTAGELAKYVYEHSKNATHGGNEFYDDKNVPLPERQQALDELVKNKISDIMDGVSNYRDTPHGMTQIEWLQKGRGILSNLERLTGLAPENKDGQAVLAQIADKSNAWLNDPNQDWGNHRVANVIASTEQAVEQGFADKSEDDAAKKADLMRMINVITGLLGNVAGPVTGKVTEKVSEFLTENVGKGLADQISEWGQQGFDKLSDDAKEKFVDKIIEDGDQDAYLDAFRSNASEFVSTELLAQLDQSTTAGRQRADIIMSEAEQYSTTVTQDG